MLAPAVLLLGIAAGCSCSDESPTITRERPTGGGEVIEKPVVPPPPCVDADGDGYGADCESGGDCDDADPRVGSTASRSCYEGADSATRDVGVCKAGTNTCTAGQWSSVCEGQVTPTDELCDNLDNNCDGLVDEQIERACYTGPAGTGGVGACKRGVHACVGGKFGACLGEVLPDVEICDGIDNDCNGTVDDDDVLVRSCYDGPSGTLGVGVCSAGTQICSNGKYAACGGEMLPRPESCDGLDNDCNGAVDDSLATACYEGPAGTAGVGACAAGVRSCSAGSFGSCLGQVLPVAEVCDGIDNDCDGQVDEDVFRACYTGPAGTAGVGVCSAGRQACSAGAWGACQAQVLPGAEVCDAKDNDCDGKLDEDLTRSCYEGPSGSEGIGACHAGTQACSAGAWGTCQGQVLPAAEVCDNSDNNCNGKVDETLTRSCYSGPAATRGVGLCAGGTQACSAGAWGACSGEVLPANETCDSVDNDCDGIVDENLVRSCYDGPGGTQGFGACAAGTQSCSAGAWGTCSDQRQPMPEVCDGVDNDCDGQVDEELVRSCYGGPAGTAGVGACRGGRQSCVGGTWDACLGEITPAAEVCDGVDNNCNGATDENLVRTCYEGPANTAGVGACRAGTQACSNGAYTACSGQTLPVAETCDSIDNDCDALVDEAVTRSCYSGPAGTEGAGLCGHGVQSCVAGQFGACAGETLPAPELCDGLDNDCDGRVDEDLVRSCYAGPAGTQGVGLCAAGTQTCGGGAWGSCQGQVLPSSEVCDNRDNNCDGRIDESISRACYSGAPGSEGVGVCRGGTQTCVAGNFGACVGEVVPTAEICDAVDNDCDGAADDNVVRTCYDGLSGTDGKGVCHAGTQACSAGAWGSCAGQVTPTTEVCDNSDNDCDGFVDESLVRSCYAGPTGSDGVGACRAGTQTCAAGSYGTCQGQVLPVAETCDAIDNDCDGQADENVTASCYTGPAGTEGAGVCRQGVKTCTAGTFGACAGQVLPSTEVCDGFDNDCDGQVDEQLARACYGGPAGSQGVGVCKGGTQSCVNGAYGACVGEVVPAPETCDNLDNDCNGRVDENLTLACYEGPDASKDVGACHGGTRACVAGAWGACQGQVVPAAEQCDNRDNDCDGQTDETLTRLCYQGPTGTEGRGVCRAGTQACVAGSYGTCQGQVLPAAESCNGEDDNCDGTVDENLQRACYGGPAGTEGVGACRGGVEGCVNGQFQTCQGQVLPTLESCDNVDNDCDGQIDEAVTQTCYTGPPGTEGAGVCRRGTRTCFAGAFGPCEGQVLPSTEVCDSLDNDCDGQADENLVQACYSGPAGTDGVGVCRSGTTSCAAGNYGACIGEITPSKEICDAYDNDCDGQVDESLVLSCYDGPTGTQDVGACHAGHRECVSGKYGACLAQVLPSTETCDNVDNNCNGQIDEGITRACYNGPDGTAGVGICKAGTQQCAGGEWASCLGEVNPGWAEICASGQDENCNGVSDEEPCAGVGTYVCNSCPGASDSNPGTQQQPLLTINKGIQNALVYGFDRVYVANQSSAVAGVYREDVTMVNGISLEGRWVSGRPWLRVSSVRTVIENPTALGLKFPAGVGRTTVLDGFEVRAAGGLGGATTSVAVNIDRSSPILRDVFAGGLVSGAPAVATSIGVLASGTTTAPANPRIEGASLDRMAGVSGGSATSLAVGIKSVGAQLDVQFVDVTAGQAPTAGTTRGVWLVDAVGSHLRDGRIGGGRSGTCEGLYATGGVAGIVAERTWILGCEANGTATPSRGAGAMFTACVLPTNAVDPILRANGAVTGGSIPGGLTIGAAAMEGCPLELIDNPNISGGSKSAKAVGILCSHQPWDAAAGRDSPCVLTGNTVYGGLTADVTDAVAVQCEGSCLTKGATCSGSCALVSGNLLNATAALNLTHMRVIHSSPYIERNRIGGGEGGVACTHQTAVTGLELRGSSARVENNFVLAGACETAVGLIQVNERRTGDLSWPAPDIHSNTILGGGSSASTTGSQSYGVVLRTASGTPPPLGLYRNNIFVGGQNNHRVAFEEEGSYTDPAKLWNNDFTNWERGGGAKPTLYVNEGSNQIDTIAQVNALRDTNVAANLDFDPVFMNTYFDFHLQGISPLRGKGTTEGAPTRDIDGSARPSPTGTAPDIGGDEI